MQRWLLFFFAAAIAAASVAPLTMSAADWKTPRTPWGDPDLQGVWSTAAEMSTPFERPTSFGTRQKLTDAEFEQRLKQVANPGIFAGAATDPPSHWIERSDVTRNTSVVIDPPDGRLPPISAEGRQRASAGPAPFGNGPFDGPEDTSQWVRCITRGGLPGVMFPTVYNANARILQGPGYVAITYEMIHDTRVIPTDGRPHTGAALRQYFGESTGRWDGDTFVVDVTNFNGKVTFRGSSQALHIIERFRRVEKDLVRYEVTVDDPATWPKPWTAGLDMRLQPGGLFEYACQEGNYALMNMLQTSRLADQK